MLRASQLSDGSEARVVFLQFSCPGVNFNSAFKCQTECVEASVGGNRLAGAVRASNDGPPLLLFHCV